MHDSNLLAEFLSKHCWLHDLNHARMAHKPFHILFCHRINQTSWRLILLPPQFWDAIRRAIDITPAIQKCRNVETGESTQLVDRGKHPSSQKQFSRINYIYSSKERSCTSLCSQVMHNLGFCDWSFLFTKSVDFPSLAHCPRGAVEWWLILRSRLPEANTQIPSQNPYAYAQE